MIAVQSIANAIKKEFGSFFSTDAHWDMDLVRYINSRVRYIVIAKDFPFNKYNYTLVTNDTDTNYSIPYQIQTFFALDTSWDEIELYNFEDYYRQKDKTDKICIFEDRLITTKKGNIDIFYRWYPTTLTSLEWNLNMPEHFFDLVTVFASFFGFLDVKAYQKSWEKKNIWDWMIKSMATRQSDKFPLTTKQLNKPKNNSTVW